MKKPTPYTYTDIHTHIHTVLYIHIHTYKYLQYTRHKPPRADGTPTQAHTDPGVLPTAQDDQFMRIVFWLYKGQ